MTPNLGLILQVRCAIPAGICFVHTFYGLHWTCYRVSRGRTHERITADLSGRLDLFDKRFLGRRLVKVEPTSTMLDITLSFTSICLLLCICIVLLRSLTSRRSRSLPLPPGPKRLPILGNALDIPLSKQWLAFQRWAEEYGMYLFPASNKN